MTPRYASRRWGARWPLTPPGSPRCGPLDPASEAAPRLLSSRGPRRGPPHAAGEAQALSRFGGPILPLGAAAEGSSRSWPARSTTSPAPSPTTRGGSAPLRERSRLRLQRGELGAHHFDPLAVLKELHAITKDKTVYEFLQHEVVDGFHDPRPSCMRWVEPAALGRPRGPREHGPGERCAVPRAVRALRSGCVGAAQGRAHPEQAHRAQEKPDEARLKEFEGDRHAAR